VTMVTPRSGFDLEYYLGRAGEKTAGGYYLNAAQQGEPPGRWFGRGAEALGFADGQLVEREPYLNAYQQTDPNTGEQLGRAPNGYKRFSQIFAAKLAAEPHATFEWRLELEREAGQEARRSPVYTDLTVAHNKSVSVLHASFREQARRAHLAGDSAREALWRAREERVQEILQEANHAALEYLQEHAGFTRTGYHGRRVDGVEPGRWERAGLLVTTWLQGTSRAGEPHDHSHNVIGRMCVTLADGVWRAVDTMALRAQLGAMGAIVEVRVKSALAREFGVTWVPREDGMGPRDRRHCATDAGCVFDAGACGDQGAVALGAAMGATPWAGAERAGDDLPGPGGEQDHPGGEGWADRLGRLDRGVGRDNRRPARGHRRADLRV